MSARISADGRKGPSADSYRFGPLPPRPGIVRSGGPGNTFGNYIPASASDKA
jgi:hypothetical protein